MEDTSDCNKGFSLKKCVESNSVVIKIPPRDSMLPGNLKLNIKNINKSLYWIKYCTEGTYGDVAFVRFKDDPDELYIIKVQKEKTPALGGAFLHQEIFMLMYLQSFSEKFPIMGFDCAFSSISSKYSDNTKSQGILFHPKNCEYIKITNPIPRSNCLISKAVDDCETLYSLLNNLNSLNNSDKITNMLIRFEIFIKEIFDMRNEIQQPGFCHNDLHTQNILYRKTEKKFVLIDFGLAYTDEVDEGVTRETTSNIVKTISTLLGTDLDIKSPELFNNDRIGMNGPYAYKNIKGQYHNLWADFAGLIKYCVSVYKNVFGPILEDKDKDKTDFPFIVTSFLWFDKIQELFDKLFNDKLGGSLMVDLKTGIISGDDYRYFFENIAKKELDELNSVFKFGINLDGTIQKPIGGRRVLHLKSGGYQNQLNQKIQHTKTNTEVKVIVTQTPEEKIEAAWQEIYITKNLNDQFIKTKESTRIIEKNIQYQFQNLEPRTSV